MLQKRYMLTKTDIQRLRKVLEEDRSSRDKIDQSDCSIHEALLSFRNEVVAEIRSMRQEMANAIGYQGSLDDRAHRIEMLEEYRRLAKIPRAN